MADSIFINYRRDDAGAEASLIATALRQERGHDSVFMDTSSLEAGARWPETVRSTLDKSTIVVAVIGPDWLRISDEWGRRRIGQDHDWVRQELARALADSAKLVIPVLVSGARIPPESVLLKTSEHCSHGKRKSGGQTRQTPAITG